MELSTVKLCVRIAREIHMPISCVLSLPVHELNLWAEVFKAEYYDAHPDERVEKDCQETDIMSYQAYALLGGDVKGGK